MELTFLPSAETITKSNNFKWTKQCYLWVKENISIHFQHPQNLSCLLNARARAHTHTLFTSNLSQVTEDNMQSSSGHQGASQRIEKPKTNMKKYSTLFCSESKCGSFRLWKIVPYQKPESLFKWNFYSWWLAFVGKTEIWNVFIH